MPNAADLELGVQVTYATACATAWLAWDTAIHFDVEIECIWKRPNSWVKWAYFFIRYAPILHGAALFTLDTDAKFSTSGCRGWVYYQLIFVEVLTFAVEAVLVMRLYVLYNHNKIILWMIILAFAAEFTMMIASLALVLPKMTFNPNCLTSHAPAIFMAYWLSSLAFETFLFILTLIKFFQSISRERTSILFVFVRDGTWAFALIFVAMLLNMLMYKLNKTPLVGMGYGWAFACMSFAGSHVLLNLRRLSLPGDHPATLTGISFSPQSGLQRTTGITTSMLTTDMGTTVDDTHELKAVSSSSSSEGPITPEPPAVEDWGVVAIPVV